MQHQKMAIRRLHGIIGGGGRFQQLFSPKQVQLAHFSSLNAFSVSKSRLISYDVLSTSNVFSNQRRSFAVTTEILETLGESITSAVLVSWSKEPGDSVSEDDVIAIVETDKVTMDIKAKKDGVFVEG